MALADVLTPDGDIADAKMALTRTLHIVVGAAEEYAKAALGAANEVLGVAMEGGPCAAAYTNYAEIGKFMRLSQTALENATDVASILMSLNESADDHANDCYGDHLAEMTRAAEIGALLEGATSRLGMINRALPKDPQPAARFDASIFRAQEGARD